MKLFYILIFSLLFIHNSHSQYEVKGLVIDFLDQTAISGVTVLDLNDTSNGAISGKRGQFSLSLQHIPSQIQLSFVGYETQTINITDRNQQELIVQLKRSTTTLPEVAISSKRPIDVIYKEPHSIVDYEFEGDFIILLAYKNAIEKYSLIVLNEDDEVIHELSLKDKQVVSLYKACTHEVHLVTMVNAYKISIDNQSISLEKAISLNNFDNLLAPCVLATQNFVYFSRYYFQGQALQYYAFQKGNEQDSILQLPLIEDVKNIDLLIWEMGARMPRSGDVWSDNVSYDLEQLREHKYALAGFKKILFPKLYVPIIQKDSLLCIFNHVDSKLQFLTEQGDSISQIPISYHRQKKWRKKIFFDEIAGRAYTSYHTRWGENIREIDLKTGALGQPIALDKAFPEKLKARNGYLYFLYRKDNGTDWNKKLHKMRVD